MNDRDNGKDEFLEAVLGSWKVPHGLEKGVRERVLSRLQGENKARSHRKFPLLALPKRPLMQQLGWAVACLATLVFIIQAFRGPSSKPAMSEEEIIQAYCLVVDPIYRMEAGRSEQEKTLYNKLAKDGADPVMTALIILKNRYRLTPGAFEQLVSVHERFGPELRNKYQELLLQEKQYLEFEQHKAQDMAIDFIAFHKWLQVQRSLQESSREITHYLLQSTASNLPPSQRAKFLNEIQQTLPHQAI